MLNSEVIFLEFVTGTSFWKFTVGRGGQHNNFFFVGLIIIPRFYCSIEHYSSPKLRKFTNYNNNNNKQI